LVNNLLAASSARLKTRPEPGFWDNLIPLRPSLSGVQLAGWQPGPPVMSGLGCQLLADQRIPVSGNVSLAADVYTPKTEGRYPAVVVFGAYNKELDTSGVPVGTNEVGCPPVFTDRGYAHIIVTRRGATGSSLLARRRRKVRRRHVVSNTRERAHSVPSRLRRHRWGDA
jgi:hypothetical protein